ncbi:hypothetical protein S245_040588, partial [Arachis hypogaea]
FGVGFYSAYLVVEKASGSFIMTSDTSGEQLERETKCILFRKEDQIKNNTFICLAYLEERRIKNL